MAVLHPGPRGSDPMVSILSSKGIATSNKGIATSNKGITSSKKFLGAPGLTTSSKKLLVRGSNRTS